MRKEKRQTKPKLILKELSSYPGVPISHKSLYEKVWEGEKFLPEIATNALQVNVCYARRLLNGEGEIRSVWGFGYMFMPSEAQC